MTFQATAVARDLFFFVATQWLCSHSHLYVSLVRIILPQLGSVCDCM